MSYFTVAGAHERHPERWALLHGAGEKAPVPALTKPQNIHWMYVLPQSQVLWQLISSTGNIFAGSRRILRIPYQKRAQSRQAATDTRFTDHKRVALVAHTSWHTR